MTSSVRTLSVFFPAYFDEHNIDRLVPAAVNVLESLELDEYEVIIIEDGSPDDTGKVADDLAARYENVRVIHHTHNRGYGATLKHGFKSAKLDWVFYTDGDCQFDVAELKKFVELAKFNDAIIGFREYKQYSQFRKLTSFVYNLLIRWLFGLRVVDVNCAFKLLPRDLFEDLEITSHQGFIDAEVLLHARRRGLSVAQIGVTHYPRTEGVATAARPSVIFGTWYETIKYWWKHRSEFSKVPTVNELRFSPPKIVSGVYVSPEAECVEQPADERVSSA